jgi:hypothetical protein
VFSTKDEGSVPYLRAEDERILPQINVLLYRTAHRVHDHREVSRVHFVGAIDPISVPLELLRFVVFACAGVFISMFTSKALCDSQDDVRLNSSFWVPDGAVS